MESGRARATDRGSGGLALAEGNELKLFFHVVTPSGSRHDHGVHVAAREAEMLEPWRKNFPLCKPYGAHCLLYTSDAADE